MMKTAVLTCLAVLASTATAKLHHRGMWHLPGDDAPQMPSAANTTFDQLIDHKDPSLGTFKQFYMYDTTHWKGPGSPVVLFTPGEVNASLYTSYLTTNRTTGVLAKEIGAATIVIEHRFWGTSTPYTNLTTANLQQLTLDNAIHDLTHFAQTVELPFAKNCSSNAADVPWVIMGGSYSGALSAWTESVAPGVFWAYHASSAPVEAIWDYSGYFAPVAEGMARNCSKDVDLVIDYLDGQMRNGTAAEKQRLKAMFGLGSVAHDDDFMAALENGPWLWQGNQFYASAGFFTWCDYVENAVNATNATTLPGADGVGLDKALHGYARWMREWLLPDFCNETYGYFAGGNNTACFDTYDRRNPMYTDTSLSNTVDRQWVWMTCNEPFGYWQDGMPAGRPTLVSRLVDLYYWTRQCGLYFPPGPRNETFGLNRGVTQAHVNGYTRGWSDVNSTRLIYANGGFDPWRESGVSADQRPGGPLKSTPQVPVNVVPGGFHTSDLVTKNGAVNPGCKAVIDNEVAQLAEWVREFPKYGNHSHHWHA